VSGPLQQGQLAVDGRDLQTELGLAQGPAVGELLRALLDAVLDEPALNQRDALLSLARRWLADGGAPPHRQPAEPEAGEKADDGPAATIGDPGAVPS
jgi:hypothetical protein